MLFRAITKELLFRLRLYRASFLQNKFHILAYHMITKQPNGFFPETSVHAFEKQISYLARNYTVVPLETIIVKLIRGQPLRRLVAITFDDGFKDNYENALPVLVKYEIPATIFITTSYIDDQRPPWFIILRYLFMRTSKKRFNLRLNHEVSLACEMQNAHEKFIASEKLMTYLKSCSNEERIDVLERLPDILGGAEMNQLDGLMLTWDTIRTMTNFGCSFEAHTVNHPIMSRIPADIAEKEIRESKERIEDELGVRVTSFAYPFGRKTHYNNSLFPILKKYGFLCAVTTERNVNNPRVNVYELNRAEPWELSMVNNG